MTAARLKDAPAGEAATRRLRLQLEGLVQGVGLRPAIGRLASALALHGWVANTTAGVTVEIEGQACATAEFMRRLHTALPPLARLERLCSEELPLAAYESFRILESIGGGAQTALVLPDVATCDQCLREILDPADRRYRYPFTNCTNCGPRFSILETQPYDRKNSTMRDFAMCRRCRAEYDSENDRRFHAQPNACPDCGPELTLLDSTGMALAQRDDALLAAAAGLRSGRIVALKGLGGFQLLVDASNDRAVAELRRRKGRAHKPFAVMASSLVQAARYCRVSDLECKLLDSAAAPIVLLQAHHADGAGLAAAIAPGNPTLGVMLPYTPLHHLLMRELDFPVVATSGNVVDEPMAIGTSDALDRLRHIADLLLTHDRRIARAVDDSVARIIGGRPCLLRRARGHAPLPVTLPRPLPALVALGGHLKSAPAITLGARVIVGSHVGDLDSAPARRAFHRAVDGLHELHRAAPAAVACDWHPDYYSSCVARQSGSKVIAVPHHLAHIVACMTDNGIEDAVLGVAWDGSGFGDDGTVWGGEFIVVDGVSTQRVAHLRPFPLPGGDKAVTEPRRAALGVLHELRGEQAFDDAPPGPLADFSEADRNILKRMLVRAINTPRTTSAGRLFDAVASLLGLMQQTSFEGQAAMALEFAIGDVTQAGCYPMPVIPRADGADGAFIVDWRPLIAALLADIDRGVPTAQMAAAFHNAMAESIVSVAQAVGQSRVVLSGGCFQNRYLTERAAARLRATGFEAYWHRHVPPNDGGLALGQAVWAGRLIGAGAV